MIYEQTKFFSDDEKYGVTSQNEIGPTIENRSNEIKAMLINLVTKLEKIPGRNI
jgi:hypothetical protein